MISQETQPEITPRRKFHFSLATLMLIALLIGAAGTTWWRWDPWVLKRSVIVDGASVDSFSSDDKFLILKHADYWQPKPYCVDVQTGVQYEYPADPIAISPDGRFSLGHLSETTFALKKINDDENILALECDSSPRAVFSADSRHLIIEFSDCSMAVWNVATAQQELKTPPFNSKYCQLNFSADGNLLFCLNADGALRIYNLKNSKMSAEIHGQRYAINFFELSPDSKLLFAACSDAQARIFQVPDGKLKSVCQNFDDYIYSAAFSSDSELISITTWSGGIYIYGCEAGYLRQINTATRVNVIKFLPGNTRLLTGNADATISVWDVSGREVLHINSEPSSSGFYPLLPKVLNPSAENSDDTVNTADDAPEHQPKSAEKAWTSRPVFAGPNDQIQSLQISEDQAFFATGFASGHSSFRDDSDIFRLWDWNTGEEICPQPDAEIVAISKDGKTVAVHQREQKRVDILESRRRHAESRLVAQPEILFGMFLLMLLVFKFVWFIRGK